MMPEAASGVAATLDTTPPIRAVPVTYRGTRFRSTLEANWAATFDRWGWQWQYEPVALEAGGVAYLPDFHLPSQRVWTEVKGPHNQRIDKTKTLARALEVPADEWTIATPLVVILRAPVYGDQAVWESATVDQDVILVDCFTCGYLGFMDYAAGWMCRRCYQPKPWAAGGGYYRPGQIDFWRAG